MAEQHFRALYLTTLAERDAALTRAEASETSAGEAIAALHDVIEERDVARREVAALRAIEKWLDVDPDRRSLERIDGVCLPRVRELVQISRRRCDGCTHWDRDVAAGGADCGWCDAFSMGSMATASGESCSRWEERRG